MWHMQHPPLFIISAALPWLPVLVYRMHEDCRRIVGLVEVVWLSHDNECSDCSSKLCSLLKGTVVDKTVMFAIPYTQVQTETRSAT